MILLIVYTELSRFAAGGYWRQLPASAVLFAIALSGLSLSLMIGVAVLASRRLGFDWRDGAAAVFCGSKKVSRCVCRWPTLCSPASPTLS